MQKLTELQQQIEKLQLQANAIRAKEFDATVADILATMSAFGITVKDLQQPQKGKSKSIRETKPKGTKPKAQRSAVAAKYRGPSGELWTGRGLMPKWLSTLVAQGQTKESFLISASTAEQS